VWGPHGARDGLEPGAQVLTCGLAGYPGRVYPHHWRGGRLFGLVPGQGTIGADRTDANWALGTIRVRQHQAVQVAAGAPRSSAER